MTVKAPRVAGRWAAGSVPDAPGFRRRHRLLAALLALHLPGLAVLAVVTGGRPQDILVQAAVVVLAVAAGAFLDIAPRLRALALAGGLLWCSVVVGVLAGTALPGALHAAAFGLLAAAHLGASWRSPRTSRVGESAVAALDEFEEPVTDGERSAEGLVEVREVFTGVWSAKHLVRPTTRLVRLEPEPGGVAEPAGVTHAVPDADASAEPEVIRTADDHAVDDHAAPRDHDLTREVLEALHLGTVEPTHPTSEHATSGSATT